MAEELKNNNNEEVMSSNFIHTFIDEDIAEGGEYVPGTKLFAPCGQI